MKYIYLIGLLITLSINILFAQADSTEFKSPYKIYFVSHSNAKNDGELWIQLQLKSFRNFQFRDWVGIEDDKDFFTIQPEGIPENLGNKRVA